jgi:hypothetical protein
MVPLYDAIEDEYDDYEDDGPAILTQQPSPWGQQQHQQQHWQEQGRQHQAPPQPSQPAAQPPFKKQHEAAIARLKANGHMATTVADHFQGPQPPADFSQQHRNPKQTSRQKSTPRGGPQRQQQSNTIDTWLQQY